MAEADERRRRVIAFILITIVFLFSVAALLYWAINVAAARISSRVTTHFLGLNPMNCLRSTGAMFPGGATLEIG